ncbi:MAG: hypothetical protein EOM26_07330 [Alphaproteobacteria bacterium]|nr:hypothetical protein [Alphaproteobacteria bacterium]
MRRISVFACAALLALTGCFDRELADSRITRGCVAVVESLAEVPDGTTLKGPNNVAVTASPLGSDFRKVSLTMTFDDGWYAEEKPFECTFQESVGVLGSHKAVFHYAKLGDKEYGTKDGQVIGSMQDHIKISQTVEDAMAR